MAWLIFKVGVPAEGVELMKPDGEYNERRNADLCSGTFYHYIGSWLVHPARTSLVHTCDRPSRTCRESTLPGNLSTQKRYRPSFSALGLSLCIMLAMSSMNADVGSGHDAASSERSKML